MGNYGLSQKEGVIFTVKTLQKIGIEGKLDSYMQKNEIRTFSNTIHKEKLKMEDLTVRLDAIKLIEENRTLSDTQ